MQVCNRWMSRPNNLPTHTPCFPELTLTSRKDTVDSAQVCKKCFRRTHTHTQMLEHTGTAGTSRCTCGVVEQQLKQLPALLQASKDVEGCQPLRSVVDQDIDKEIKRQPATRASAALPACVRTCVLASERTAQPFPLTSPLSASGHQLDASWDTHTHIRTRTHTHTHTHIHAHERTHTHTSSLA